MSQSIWTQCEGSSRLQPLEAEAVRVVEAQHLNSTRKLVDSAAEQTVLEDLIDKYSKPRAPPGCEGLHYLLWTPFRHPPLRSGTRFGTKGESGFFYASREIATALAEKAYYRFVFSQGTAADLGTTITSLTAFRAAIRTRRAIDLTEPPFARHREKISSKTDYAVAQRLGREMRADGVEVCAYSSARARDDGVNYAVFSLNAFGKKKPLGQESWSCAFTREVVEFKRVNIFDQTPMRFERSQFEVNGSIPQPAA